MAWLELEMECTQWSFLHLLPYYFVFSINYRHYKKWSVELRLTKTQLQSHVWAAFYTNATPLGCLSYVFGKRSSTSAEAVFEMVQAMALGYIQKKKKNRLEIGAAFIKRGSNFYKREKLKFWGAIVGVKAWTFVLGLKPHLPIGMRPRRSKQLERP